MFGIKKLQRRLDSLTQNCCTSQCRCVAGFAQRVWRLVAPFLPDDLLDIYWNLQLNCLTIWWKWRRKILLLLVTQNHRRAPVWIAWNFYRLYLLRRDLFISWAKFVPFQTKFWSESLLAAAKLDWTLRDDLILSAVLWYGDRLVSDGCSSYFLLDLPTWTYELKLPGWIK